MIRKLKSGEYRLYSRKQNPKTGRRRNLGTFKSRAAAKSTNARYSISSGIDDASRRMAPGRLGEYRIGGHSFVEQTRRAIFCGGA